MNDKCEAIAWLANIKEKYIHGGDEEFDEFRRESIDMAIKALRQPQIVRCKECRNAVVYDGNEVICAHIDSNGNDKHTADWFCADGRKNDD